MNYDLRVLYAKTAFYPDTQPYFPFLLQMNTWEFDNHIESTIVDINRVGYVPLAAAIRRNLQDDPATVRDEVILQLQDIHGATLSKNDFVVKWTRVLPSSANRVEGMLIFAHCLF